MQIVRCRLLILRHGWKCVASWLRASLLPPGTMGNLPFVSCNAFHVYVRLVVLWSVLAWLEKAKISLLFYESEVRQTLTQLVAVVRCINPVFWPPRSGMWASCTRTPRSRNPCLMPRGSKLCVGTRVLWWPRCWSAPSESSFPRTTCPWRGSRSAAADPRALPGL